MMTWPPATPANQLNVKNLNRLIAKFKKLREQQFDHGVWHQQTACGTVACVAGWAAECATTGSKENRFVFEYGLGLRVGLRVESELGTMSVPIFAAAWLGVDRRTAHALFNPHSNVMRQTKPKHVVAALEMLRERGEFRTPWWREILERPRRKRVRTDTAEAPPIVTARRIGRGQQD